MTLINLLASNLPAFVCTALLLSLLIGSFLNVVIYRLPKILISDWKSQAREILGLTAEPRRETFNLILPNSRCPPPTHQTHPS